MDENDFMMPSRSIWASFMTGYRTPKPPRVLSRHTIDNKVRLKFPKTVCMLAQLEAKAEFLEKLALAE